MTGDDEGEAVRRAHRPRSPGRPRTTGERRELTVRDDLAPRHSPQRHDDVALERRGPVEIDLDVPEVHGLAAEKGMEAIDERVEPLLRPLVPVAELVLDEDTVRPPDLAGAPARYDVPRLDDRHRDHSRIAGMTAHGFFKPPLHDNEPVLSYAPGSPERAELQARLRQMESERISIPMIIGGKDVHTN